MIKFIASILSLLYVLLVGTPQPKYDLRRQPTKDDFKRNLNYWIARNFNFIALATVTSLLVVFVLMCFWLVGVSATDSGTVYNHLGGVI